MCILFLHVNPEPKSGEFRLIVATNRDEHYKRPAARAVRDDETGVIGGRDMEPGREGGMWLGFKKKKQPNGKEKFCFTALTNITGASVQNAAGRGFIVRNYLESSKGFQEYVEELENGKKYNGYNLVVAELSPERTSLYHHGNIPVVDSVYSGKQTLAFGNTPTFCPLKKVYIGRNKFEEILNKQLQKDELIKELLNLLKDRTRHLPDPELERRAPSEMEYLSSAYVEFEKAGYGTRTHTIVLIDSDWNAEFIEYTMEQPIDLKNPKWIVTKITSKM